VTGAAGVRECGVNEYVIRLHPGMWPDREVTLAPNVLSRESAELRQCLQGAPPDGRSILCFNHTFVMLRDVESGGVSGDGA
jgi:hypothetical protein